MSRVQQLAYPLRFVSGRPVMVDQDSPQEIRQCVQVVLAYPLGGCIDLPEFGRPDPTFSQTGPNGPDPVELEAVIDRWEPRATGAVIAGTVDQDGITGLTVTLTPGGPRA